MKGTETHPTYGLAVLTKSTGGATCLFGSRVQHSTTVHLTIYNASQKRDLSQDWRHTEDIIVDLEMSAAQWAAMVSSFGDGSGTPVTLKYKKTGPMEKCGDAPPYISDRVAHEKDSNDTIEKALALRDELLEQFDFCVQKPGKKNLAEFRKELDFRLYNILKHIPFIAKSYEQKMHEVEQDAKTEVEAFVTTYLTDLGLQAAIKHQGSLSDTHDLKEITADGHKEN